MTRHIQPVPSRQGVHWPQSSVHVKFRQTRNCLDYVSGFVHHHDPGGAQPAACSPQTVKIHQHFVADRLGDQRHRRTTRNNRQQIVPPAAHAAGVLLDQFPQRDAEFFFDIAGLVDVTRDAEDLLPRVVLPAQAGEPRRSAPKNCRSHRDRFDIIYCRGASVQPDGSREWRLHPRHTFLALEALQQGRFFTAKYRHPRCGEENIVIVTRAAGILADQPSVVSLVDRMLQHHRLIVEFTANVDVGGGRAHCEAGDQTPLHQFMRIMPYNVAILARARLRTYPRSRSGSTAGRTALH